MEDELVFLGSGGGRHHVRTQYRATGGILYKFNNIQCHIDPGPGAIVRINQFGEDPTKTELFIVTHVHLDHFNDISVMIESSREQLHDRNYNYYKKGMLITTTDVIKYISRYHLNMLEKVVIFKPGDELVYKDVKITATKVVHSKDTEGFGVKFYLKDYTIGFSSDTMVFDGFSEQFNDVDILVLNLLRPNSVTCKRHLCTNEVIPYLKMMEPKLKALIITHFGAYMDSPFSRKNFVPSQVQIFEEKTKIKKIIAARDGLKIKVKNQLIS